MEPSILRIFSIFGSMPDLSDLWHSSKIISFRQSSDFDSNYIPTSNTNVVERQTTEHYCGVVSSGGVVIEPKD